MLSIKEIAEQFDIQTVHLIYINKITKIKKRSDKKVELINSL